MTPFRLWFARVVFLAALVVLAWGSSVASGTSRRALSDFDAGVAIVVPPGQTCATWTPQAVPSIIPTAAGMPGPTVTPPPLAPAVWAGVQFLGQEAESDWQALAAAGFGTARVRVIQSGSEVPHAWIGREVARAERYGTRVLLTFWVQGAGKIDVDCSTASVAAYTAAAREIARVYKGRIWAYQIDSEPDLCKASAASYSARLIAAWQAIKAEDPKALVVMGGLAYETYAAPLTWLDDALRTLYGSRCWPCMDAIAVHSYADDWGRWPGGLEGKLAAVRKRMKLWGLTLPVWVSEGGASSGPSNQWHERTPATQAKLVADYLMRCRTLPLCVVFRATDGLEVDQYGIIGKPAMDAARKVLGDR